MRIIQTSLLCAALALPAGRALAQANGPTADQQKGSQQWAQAQPNAGAPPSTAAPAQPETNAPAAPSAAPAGQWVYTEQYGWLWMPYGTNYLHAPADDYGTPYMYVYGPTIGWTWVDAPWIWGWGPAPYFGAWGPWRFGWYGHGWWGHRWYGYAGYPYGWRGGYFAGGRGYFGGGRGYYAPWRGTPAYRGYGFHGAAPAAPRGTMRSAPARSFGGHHR